MKLRIYREHWLITIVLLILWTIAMRFAFFVNISNEREQTEMLLLEQSRLLGRSIVLTWMWNAYHGGVYVPMADNLEPNQFLDENIRTITAENGDQFVNVTPAWMGQGIGAMAGANQIMSITTPSRSPISDRNTATEWDLNAFEQFEQGALEVVDPLDTFRENGELRYMLPMYASTSCLDCHNNQGFEEGSLIGGVKIAMFSEPFLTWYNSELTHMIVTSTLIWLFGCIGIMVTMSSISRRIHENEKLSKFEGVLEMAGTAAHELNQPLQIISGYAELISMLNDDDRESMNEMLEEIRDNIIRLSTITRKLNNITRYETIELSSRDRIIDLDRSAASTQEQAPFPNTTHSDT